MKEFQPVGSKSGGLLYAIVYCIRKTFLVSTIMNEAISACRFLTGEGSYMRVSTVLGATVLVSIRMNEAISACKFLANGRFLYAAFNFHAVF